MSENVMTTLSLSPTLESTAAAPLVAELLLLRGQPVTVAADTVSRASTPCMQVLLSAVATWKADGIPFHINGPSEGLLEAARLLGLSEEQLAMDRSI